MGALHYSECAPHSINLGPSQLYLQSDHSSKNFIPKDTTAVLYIIPQISIMTLKSQIVCLFMVGAVFVLASTPSALYPAPAIRMAPSPTATSLVEFANLTGSYSSPRKRGSRNGEPAQKRFSGCPEWFSGTKFDCELCGGESPTLPGFCLKRTPEGARDCQCKLPSPILHLYQTLNVKLLILELGTPTVITPETTTVVQATVGSDTATGTYELETLTQFAGLREHITIMTSETATASDSSVETFAAVVLAGGVAWFLAGKFNTFEIAYCCR